MPSNIYRIIIVTFSRSIAKFFLFFALSISTPTVNAMRSLQEQEPIVIVKGNSFRRKDRSLTRRFGYQPEMRFVMFDELRSAYV